jgi:hypothetical protein
MTRAAAFLTGLIFAAGLIVSGMVDPARVLGFLDLSGPWDPTLGFVFAGALAVAAPGMQLVLRRGKPLFGGALGLPDSTAIDRPLVAGAAIFGIGWGLAGFCPGPAVTALGAGKWPVFLFVAAMVAGMVAHSLAGKLRAGPTDG